MKKKLLLLNLVVGVLLGSSCLASSSVEVAGRDSPEENDYGIWKADSPDGKYFAVTRPVPSDEFLWRPDFDSAHLLIRRSKPEDYFGDIYFQYAFSGRLIETAAWSPDSQYLIFTTASSGGHSSWHHCTYVVRLEDKRIASVDDKVGLVISPEISVKAPHTAILGLNPSGGEGVDIEHPKSTEIDLASLFKE